MHTGIWLSENKLYKHKIKMHNKATFMFQRITRRHDVSNRSGGRLKTKRALAHDHAMPFGCSQHRQATGEYLFAELFLGLTLSHEVIVDIPKVAFLKAFNDMIFSENSFKLRPKIIQECLFLLGDVI
jgi:hypothetical protein